MLELTMKFRMRRQRLAQELGGFVFPNAEDTIRKFRERIYILDGQQRATSLLLSIFGGKGKVKRLADCDYELYFDAIGTVFFFANEFNKRKRKVTPAFLISLKDAFERPSDFCRHISGESGFNQTIENNLRHLSRIFTDYKISLIVLGALISLQSVIYSNG
jgi:hypothetical protein